MDVPATAELLYAMRTGAALMLGWTLLLAWAALSPLERRGVVFLTVLPVILGLMTTEVVAVRGRFVPAANAAPLLGLQMLLGLFGLWAWARATGTPGEIR